MCNDAIDIIIGKWLGLTCIDFVTHKSNYKMFIIIYRWKQEIVQVSGSTHNLSGKSKPISLMHAQTHIFVLQYSIVLCGSPSPLS